MALNYVCRRFSDTLAFFEHNGNLYIYYEEEVDKLDYCSL